MDGVGHDCGVLRLVKRKTYDGVSLQRVWYSIDLYVTRRTTYTTVSKSREVSCRVKQQLISNASQVQLSVLVPQLK